MAHPKQAGVRARAANVCEYCRLPGEECDILFAVDHVIAKQHGGTDDDENLAWACFHCNLKKGPNIGGIDVDSKSFVRLFNPRADRWEDHFMWSGPQVRALTPIGRVTLHVLAMNAAGLIHLRASLIEEGRFPPSV